LMKTPTITITLFIQQIKNSTGFAIPQLLFSSIVLILPHVRARARMRAPSCDLWAFSKRESMSRSGCFHPFANLARSSLLCFGDQPTTLRTLSERQDL
jgi:hypothetical protein